MDLTTTLPVRTIAGVFPWAVETKSATATRPAKDDREAKAVQTPFQVKADSIDDESRTFTGLASTWDLDLGGDVIRKGAFKRTLAHWKKAKKPLPLLDSHNAWGTVRAVIGKMEEAQETDAGLEATFSVIDGPDGDEVWRRIKGGYVTGLSIGYRPVKIKMPSEEEEREGVWRFLDEVELREVSVVLYPMNPGAQIDPGSMKALGASIAALEEVAASRALTDEEKAELTELHTKVGELLDSGAGATPAEPASVDPAEPTEGKEIAVDDPDRVEMERRLTERRLATHGTRVRSHRS